MPSPRQRWPSLADGIYAIIDTSLVGDPVVFARGVLAGGVRVLQLRAKGGIDREQLRDLVVEARAAGAILIVNDDVEAAAAADGVHLGQEDAALVDLAALRRRFAEKIIGLSCGTPEEATAANGVGVDYLGVGAMFATSTKRDAGDPIGIEGVAAIVRASAAPVVAIGGLTADRLTDVRASGARMAAVISALSADGAPQAAAARLVAAWERTR
jgi:thiamine-phosphate pyrophosphorylase